MVSDRRIIAERLEQIDKEFTELIERATFSRNVPTEVGSACDKIREGLDEARAAAARPAGE